MSDLEQLREDMDTFLTEWGQAMLRRRVSLSYDLAGMAIENWSSSLSFNGDLQPISGREVAAEAGLEHPSEEKIEATYDVDVRENDRVEKDGVTYRTNYVKSHPDHVNIYVYKEIVQ
jgi:hypothetical protein